MRLDEGLGDQTVWFVCLATCETGYLDTIVVIVSPLDLCVADRNSARLSL